MKLFCEITQDVQVITEADEHGQKNFFIEGTFMQGAVTNKNGRRYPTDLLAREVDRYRENYIDQNRAYGELGHPSGPNINLERVSHMIKGLRQEGNDFIGKAKILDTPYGQIVKNLMREGAKLGVSSRGMGSLKKVDGLMEVQDDFYLATAADIVADPSAPKAFVQGIMENKEWVWDNGILKEQDVVAIKDDVEDAFSTKQSRETIFLQAFSKFLTRL